MGPNLSSIGFNLQDKTLLRPATGKKGEETGLPSDTFASSANVRTEPKASDDVVKAEPFLERPGQSPLSLPGEQIKVKVEAAPTTLIQEPEAAPQPAAGQTLADIAKEVAGEVDAPGSKISEIKPKVEIKPEPVSTGQKIGVARRIGNALLGLVASDPLKEFRAELNKINELESMAKELKTPADFQAKTAEFKARLEKGESLQSIRPEAYAVAREAARIATKSPDIPNGMRAYDCQVLGALTLDNGPFAEMKTGEGKTLTAVLPLYLNALTGKGAHLVTVNDTLASRDAEWMGPAFEMLGMSVGTVLEGMSNEEKKAGYACDVTYTTDRTIGFDYLRDQTAKHPDARVQRGFHFAIVDEVDEVLIDEARTPLIISGMGEPAEEEYKIFNEIAKTLIPGKDYYTEPKNHAVWLTDTGGEWVENQLQLREIQKQLAANPTPLQRAELQLQKDRCHEYGKAIREEQEAYGAFVKMDEARPGFFKRLFGADFDKEQYRGLEDRHEELQDQREEMAARTPRYALYSEQNSHRARYLQASLKAHAMFDKDIDYMVAPDPKKFEAEKKRLAKALGPNITAEQQQLVEAEAARRSMGVHIVDENKGRTSEGRRYNDGIHQALEAKEGVPIQNEQRTIASITYPNLFKKYERWSGMSGTCKTSEGEFVKLYDREVSVVPTNKPVIRKDEVDVMFRTQEEKYRAVARDAAKDFFEGRPVLIGTLSVEHNLYMANMLYYAGVPWEAIQVLNAETVRGDKAAENEMISNAGRSGVITVATHMAGRGANIKPDLVNFKTMSVEVAKALQENKPVVVELRKETEAQWMAQWLEAAQPKIVDGKSQEMPKPGEVMIRVTKEGGEAPEGGVLLKGSDFPTGGLHAYLTERANSPRIDNQFKGRSGRQGAPGLTRVYGSMEDEILKVYGGVQRDILESLIPAAGGVADSRLDQLGLTMEQIAQAYPGQDGAPEVEMLKKRATVGFLGDALTNDESNMGDLMANVAGESVWKDVQEHLPKGDLQPQQVQDALAEAEKAMGYPLGRRDDGRGFLASLPTLPQDGEMDREQVESAVKQATARGLMEHVHHLSTTIADAKSVVTPEQDLADAVTDEQVNALPQSTQDFLGFIRSEMLAVRMIPGEGLADDRLHKLLDTTQMKVEESHFSARENTNKKDETLSTQREAFYKYRDRVLHSHGRELQEEFTDMVGDAITEMVFTGLPDRKRLTYGQIRQAVAEAEKELNIPISLPFLEHKQNPDSSKISADDLDHELRDYAERTTSKALRTMGKVTKNVDSALRGELLDIVDQTWSEHLEDMAALQDGIHWMAVAQKDPEVEFKIQAFETFENMTKRLKHRSAGEFLPKLLAWSQHVEEQERAQAQAPPQSKPA